MEENINNKYPNLNKIIKKDLIEELISKFSVPEMDFLEETVKLYNTGDIKTNLDGYFYSVSDERFNLAIIRFIKGLVVEEDLISNIEKSMAYENEKNKIQKYYCPDYVINLLEKINERLNKIVDWYDRTPECLSMSIFGTPFDTPKQHGTNNVWTSNFEVIGYNYSPREPQDYNFKCGDIEISWNKYLGRDTTINKEISEKEAIDMFNKCQEGLDKFEKVLESYFLEDEEENEEEDEL